MGDGQAVRGLYEELLTAWNERDAARMAACFDEEGVAIGFDGSSHSGPGEIRSDLGTIFEHHQTPA